MNILVKRQSSLDARLHKGVLQILGLFDPM